MKKNHIGQLGNLRAYFICVLSVFSDYLFFLRNILVESVLYICVAYTTMAQDHRRDSTFATMGANSIDSAIVKMIFIYIVLNHVNKSNIVALNLFAGIAH